MLTVTAEEATGQGTVPLTVYVYVPAGSTAGSKSPLNAPPPGNVHVPVASGVPFS